MTSADPTLMTILAAVRSGRRPSVWITRERPKIDRIACPWLVLRCIDPHARFLFVPPAQVFARAVAEHAVAFDLPGAPISHAGARCSFDAMLEYFDLRDPALAVLAPIVRGADTDRHDLAPEAAGLHAIAVGMACNEPDDQRLLAQGLVLYDALYAWAARARGERHSWQPAP